MRHARNRGQHRKPSTSGRLTAIGAVGVGTIAASILTPGAAHAATDVQWQRVAHCESRDTWHINTGNGYYGGLQFAASTWSSFDVDHFASRADLATRTQQIDVANRVLSAQGWNAWPVCSHDAGAPGSSHKLLSHHKKVIGHGHYVVKRGDTLAGIATRHHVKNGWHGLYHLNRHLIGADPQMIHAGERLKLRSHNH
jgi:hypothetical protein